MTRDAADLTRHAGARFVRTARAEFEADPDVTVRHPVELLAWPYL